MPAKSKPTPTKQSTEKKKKKMKRAGGEEEELLQLRSRATELLLKQDWKEYINLYTHFIDRNSTNLNTKPLSSAFSNRADARYRINDLALALLDCNHALRIDANHTKALITKGRILLDLDCYKEAHSCFQLALSLEKSEALRELVDRCKKLDVQSRTGVVDISDWLMNGFATKPPELAEYIGPVRIGISEKNGRRGMFVTKNVETGMPLVITKPVAIGRAILPESGDDNARMVMWKDFVDRILDAAEKCGRTRSLLDVLSTGENGDLAVPNMGLFRPGAEENKFASDGNVADARGIVKALDVNCLNEEAASAKVLGRKTNGCCSIGLWILPSFVNHSCSPNARRSHIGDTVVVHASRDLREGEEVVFAYFDVFLPLVKRRELAKRWGFECDCERCVFEEAERAFPDSGDFVVEVEEEMRRRMKGKRERGWLRASYWEAFVRVYESERMVRRWGRKIPSELVAAESVADAVGGDERVLKPVLRSLKRDRSGGGGGAVEMERVMRMGRGVYGKVVKKHGMRALFEQLTESELRSVTH